MNHDKKVERFWKMLAALGSAFVLLSCGGGGGGGDQGPVASTLDFPIGSAKSAWAQSARSFNLTGSLDGTNFAMSYSQAPGAASTFEGQAASTSSLTIIFRANGVVASQTLLAVYFAASPFVAYGSIDLGTGSYSVFNTFAILPATAKVGQSGSIGTETEYVNSSKSQVRNVTTLTWSLEADTANTAFFCVNSQISGATPGTGSECYRIDSSGAALGLIVKVMVNGKTLTLQ